MNRPWSKPIAGLFIGLLAFGVTFLLFRNHAGLAPAAAALAPAASVVPGHADELAQLRELENREEEPLPDFGDALITKTASGGYHISFTKGHEQSFDTLEELQTFLNQPPHNTPSP